MNYNDIAAGKKSKEIIADIAEIIAKLKAQNTNVQIVLISAKPSLARWNLKRRYKKLNKKLKKMSLGDARMSFADVWSAMLIKKKVQPNIFNEDGLHMNPKGYDLWYNVIKKFID